MMGILNRLFWVCWLSWTLTLTWIYSQDSGVSTGPVFWAILAPVGLRVVVWYIVRGVPLSR